MEADRRRKRAVFMVLVALLGRKCSNYVLELCARLNQECLFQVLRVTFDFELWRKK